jgi:hypothetical protein
VGCGGRKDRLPGPSCCTETGHAGLGRAGGEGWKGNGGGARGAVLGRGSTRSGVIGPGRVHPGRKSGSGPGEEPAEDGGKRGG